MIKQDADYYRRRAEEEEARALDAGHSDVAAIHEELARLYRALLDRAELRPALVAVGEAPLPI